MVSGQDISDLRPMPLFDELTDSTTISEHLTADEATTSEHLTEEQHQVDAFSGEERSLIQRMAEAGKIEGDLVKQAILLLCRHQFVPLSELASILNRAPDTLRTHYIAHLVRTEILMLLYPNKPNHPDQAYKLDQYQING